MCVVVSDLCGVTPTRERVHAALGCAETACVVVSDLWGVWDVADRQACVRSEVVVHNLNVTRSRYKRDASLLPVKSTQRVQYWCLMPAALRVL